MRDPVQDCSYCIGTGKCARCGGSGTRPALSPLEMKITRLVLNGCSDKETASELGLSWHTVRTYLRGIYQKLGVRSRYQLMRHCMEPSDLLETIKVVKEDKIIKETNAR